ncbi:Ig-like domain-containing protein, partial [Candidatus Bipolaricaulota bacterium]
HVVVDDCCEATVGFSAVVDDNCCLTSAGITITPTNPTGNLMIDFDQVRDVVFTQTAQGRVDISGVIPVHCVTSCPAIVQVTVTANDCCGNSAVPVSSTADETDPNETGHVLDETAPIPRDDPRQDVAMDESAIIDPLVVVRQDRNGRYRLLVREDGTVNFDVVANDSDNCTCSSHDSCETCGGCNAILQIHDIVTAPRYGRATIRDDNPTLRSDTTIRYAPARGFSGWDQFRYRIADACGNLSGMTTVYVEVVARSSMEDLLLTTCADVSVSFDVTAKDPWMDLDAPGDRTFEFQIVNSPTHGVVSGDLTRIIYRPGDATADGVPSAEVALTYTPAAGFVGQDRMTVQCVDPFGDSSETVIDVAVEDCTAEEEPPPITVEQGVTLSMIVPLSFRSILEGAAGSVLLVSLEDGFAYPGMLTAMWDESAGQYILLVDTLGLRPGEYLLTLPLGNGETVELTIEIGEAE